MADPFLQTNIDQNNAADDRKQGMANDRRKAVLTQYMGTANNLHKSLALLTNPDTMQPLPGKEQQAAQLRQQLGQVDDYIRKLYNPNLNPDSGMTGEDPLRKLGDKLHLTKPPAENKTAGQQMTDLKAIQDKYGEATTPGIEQQEKGREQEQNIEHARALLKKYGASDQTIQSITESMIAGPKASVTQKPVFKLFKLKDGGLQYFDVNDKESIPPDATAVASGSMTPKPRKAWGKDTKGKLFSVLLDPFTNQEVPNSRNYSEQPPSSITGRITTGFYHFVDDQGNVHQVRETRTSMPSASTVPSNLDKPSGKSGDSILGHKETAPQAKAHRDYLEAYALAKKADEVAKNPTDAFNQKRLAVALEKVSAGRFTQSALDYVKNIGWGNSIEEWANKPGTGALPEELVRQMVAGAHEEMDAKKAAWDESMNGGSSNAPTGNRNPYR